MSAPVMIPVEWVRSPDVPKEWPAWDLAFLTGHVVATITGYNDEQHWTIRSRMLGDSLHDSKAAAVAEMSDRLGVELPEPQA